MQFIYSEESKNKIVIACSEKLPVTMHTSFLIYITFLVQYIQIYPNLLAAEILTNEILPWVN